MGDQELVAAEDTFDSKTTRLLRHLALVGLLQRDRLPARDRLALELRDSPACAGLVLGDEADAAEGTTPGHAA